ncbi:hypothetical protein ABZ023_29455 [Streptomyces sp. NPDC006367]|uniref:hypothetical protein n=1 Tax=unclassified Streptomyces TaxID=2593676 RepID=UPI0033A24724
MRAISAASTALLGVAALASCVPAGAAVGTTPFGFDVRPATVAAGGTVTLHVDRSDGRCRGRVTVASAVFDTVTIPRRHFSAQAVIDRDARPGAAYQVSFTCEGRTGTTRLTIAGGHPHRPGTVPHKGVHAGEGGSIAGFDLKTTGLGVVLVAGTVGAAYHLSRHRSGGKDA